MKKPQKIGQALALTLAFTLPPAPPASAAETNFQNNQCTTMLRKRIELLEKWGQAIVEKKGCSSGSPSPAILELNNKMMAAELNVCPESLLTAHVLEAQKNLQEIMKKFCSDPK